MKSIEQLNQEITELTSMIEDKYPELHQFLTETPITIMKEPGQQVTVENLEKHLESLKTIFFRYKETQSLK